MSDFSSGKYFKDKYSWKLQPPYDKSNKSIAFNFQIIGILFENINNEGAISLTQSNSVLTLEHDTFNTVTSTQNGGCVFFNTGQLIYQSSICARNVSSTTKGHYCYVSISSSSESINYVSTISISDCTNKPSVDDMIWLGGGKISFSYYNCSNNIVWNTPSLFCILSYGQANITFINAMSCTANNDVIVYFRTAASLENSNFYNNSVLANAKFFFHFDAGTGTFRIDNCVFSENNAKNFRNTDHVFTVTSCSFNNNKFSSISPSLTYKGSHAFIVDTKCHIGQKHDCFADFNCVSPYFIPDYNLLSFSFFILNL